MMVTLHPGARQDLEEAAAFYEREGSPAVAAQLLAEFERVAKLLLAHPEVGTPRTHGRRAFPTSGYPYTIIYRQVPGGIHVLVVKHDRRRPGYGGGRR
jgi:plasmid stabilization system protein ParE